MLFPSVWACSFRRRGIKNNKLFFTSFSLSLISLYQIIFFLSRKIFYVSAFVVRFGAHLAGYLVFLLRALTCLCAPSIHPRVNTCQAILRAHHFILFFFSLSLKENILIKVPFFAFGFPQTHFFCYVLLC